MYLNWQVGGNRKTQGNYKPTLTLAVDRPRVAVRQRCYKLDRHAALDGNILLQQGLNI